MKKNRNIAIITGDIINSSSITSAQLKKMKTGLNVFLEERTDVLLPLAFYRGDSFQLMVEPVKSAEIALIIQSILLSTTETLARISIGVGSASKVMPGNVLQSEGEAFQLSGHQLDKMKDEGRIFKIATKSKGHQPMLAGSFHLAENIISGWKTGQASVITLVTRFKTQKEIAKRLNISESAVSKALKSAGWAAVKSFLDGYEQTIKMI
ncbi:MAG: SatD family protein [Prolixibacteraceae bacterium]|nr:SatD family protein [Prolixibacteraceae bacterium]